MRKKFLLLGLSGIMCLSLTACGDKAKTAKEVFDEHQKAMEKVETFEMDGDIGMAISMDMQGMALEIPLDMSFTAQATKDGDMHMDMEMTMEAMGQKETTSTEMYMDVDGNKAITYTKAEDGTWVYTEAEAPETNASTDFVQISENATLTKEEDEYIINGKLEDMIDPKAFEELLEGEGNTLTDMTASEDMSMDEIVEALGDMEITYVFDAKTFNLKSVKIEEFTFEQAIEEEGQSMNMKLSLEADIKYDKYNEIDIKDIEVPADIKESAVDANEMIDEIPVTDIEEPTTEEVTTEEVIEETTEEVTDDITQGQDDVVGTGTEAITSSDFMINGTKCNINTTVDDLVSLGFTISDDDMAKLDQTVEPYGSVILSLRDDSGINAGVAYVNDTDTDMIARDCSLSFMGFDYAAGSSTVISLLNGVYLGQTEEEAKAIIDVTTADNNYISTDSDYKTYTWYTDDSIVDITFNEGIVYSISIGVN